MLKCCSTYQVESRLWAEIHGLNYCETSASNGTGVGDMFQTFFSAIVRNQMELASTTGSMPKTPVSARRVNLGLQVPANGTPPPSPATASPQPSEEQLDTIRRLESGADPWEQLGISPGSTHEEVNKTYRRLAVLLHPDKTAVKGADDAFKMLGVARRNALTQK